MANTAKLKIVDKYMFDCLNSEFGEVLKRGKIEIGSSGIMKEFSGISRDKNTIVQLSHNSGYTSGGKNPSAKIETVLSKCLLMEKTSAENKYVYFTNPEFYEIFNRKCKKLIPEIQLKLFSNLSEEMQAIIKEVQQESSKEMTLR